jgi:hypothetical protein
MSNETRFLQRCSELSSIKEQPALSAEEKTFYSWWSLFTANSYTMSWHSYKTTMCTHWSNVGLKHWYSIQTNHAIVSFNRVTLTLMFCSIGIIQCLDLHVTGILEI